MVKQYLFFVKYMAACFIFLACGCNGAFALDISMETGFARYDGKILMAFRYVIPSGYHSYAHDPGGTGLPTSLDCTLEDAGRMPVFYPSGKAEKDIFDPGAKVNVYEGGVTLLAVLPDSAAGKLYAADIEMLLCSSRHCLPVKESAGGMVPADAPFLDSVAWKTQAIDLIEKNGGFAESPFKDDKKTNQPGIASQPVANDRPEQARDFRPKTELSKQGLATANAAPDFNPELQPRFVDADFEIYSLGKALLLGLLAGLLLNAMPCVLPVLTLKVSGILLMGNSRDSGKLRKFREYNLCFAAGVIVFFTVLAFLLGAADLIWGQLYQNQAVLLVMLVIVFLMGLSMLGVFTLPALDLRIGETSGKPRVKAFLTGLISTFLATPCSGPLLGGVLAWAFAQPMPILMAVFWAVGLGMSLPYFAFSIWPNMARILPRPGNWMYVFEHVLGFLLLATALYLLSILPSEKHMRILAMLLAVSLCAWFWGKFCGLDAPQARRRGVGALGLAFLCLAIAWALRPGSPGPQWQDFNPDSFMADLGKKNMLVEFTADWCPNCKLLEATTLSAANIRDWQKHYNLRLIRVDITRPNPAAERLLQSLGGKSIPLTAIFPTGADAKFPIVLRDIYGGGSMDEALSEAFSRPDGE